MSDGDFAFEWASITVRCKNGTSFSVELQASDGDPIEVLLRDTRETRDVTPPGHLATLREFTGRRLFDLHVRGPVVDGTGRWET